MTLSGVREHLRARLERAGASVNATESAALERYIALLAQWNPKVNLTALPLAPPTDETFDRLIVEPVVASKHLEWPGLDDVPLKWIDLGSGGGSPAIPLKIVRPFWDLMMVEARERKAAFLREAIRTLRLRDVVVKNSRFEELDDSSAADLITVRAVKLGSAVENASRRLLNREGLLAVFSSSEAALSGFGVERSVALLPGSPAVLTMLRVPRGT